MAGKAGRVVLFDGSEVVLRTGSGGKRAGAGRKKGEVEPVKLVQSYLSAEDRAYLATWGDTGTVAVRRMIERCRLMWPKGE